MIRVGLAISGAAVLIIFLLSHSARVLAAPQAAQDASNTNSQITFNKDIAPVFFQHCATCHRPGESGPFPLLSYKDAKSHARQIAAVTQSRFMPPWARLPISRPFRNLQKAGRWDRLIWSSRRKSRISSPPAALTNIGILFF